MRVEQITDVDMDDEIAFIDDLPFEYEGIFSIDTAEVSEIDWIRIDKIQVTGSLVYITATHTHTNWTTSYHVPANLRVIVYEED